MKKTMRNIANLLLVTALIPFSVSALSTVITRCGTDTAGCLASLTFGYDTAIVPYQIDLTTAESTAPIATHSITFTEAMAGVQLISTYALLVAVLILIALECIELYYIRRFIRGRRYAR